MNDEIDKSQHQKKSHTVTGKIISDKMDKTVSVAVERKVKHPLYGKYMRRTSKYIAHDEENSCRQGDIVKIEEELQVVIDYFGDKMLNDQPEFKGLNPSIEHFSRIICERAPK